MSRARRVFAAFGVGAINQALSVLIGLYVTRFTLHRIGAQNYGLWVIAGQVLTYMVLLDLGVVGILPREISVAAGKTGDPEVRDAELRDVFDRSVSLVLLLVPLIALGSAVIVALLPSQWAALRGPLAVYLALYTSVYPYRIVGAVLAGLQDLTFMGWMQSLALIASAITTLTLVVFDFGLYALAVGSFAGQVVVAVASTVRLLLRHRRVVPRRFKWASLDAVRKHLVPGAWVSIAQLSHVLMNSTDVLVVGRMLGSEAVLRFSFTDKTENILSVQPYAIGNLGGPTLGEIKGAGRRDEAARVLGVLALATLILSGGVVLAILETNEAFVRVWIGEEYFGGMILTATILANMMMRHWLFTYLVGLFYYSGRVRESTLMQLADGVLSVGLSVVLVHRIGIVGAPLGSLIAAIIAQGPAGLILMSRDSGESVGTLLSPLRPWVIRFVPLAVVAAVAGLGLGRSSLIAVAGVGALIGIAYVGLMLPLLRRPPLDVYATRWFAKMPFLARISWLQGS